MVLANYRNKHCNWFVEARTNISLVMSEGFDTRNHMESNIIGSLDDDVQPPKPAQIRNATKVVCQYLSPHRRRRMAQQEMTLKPVNQGHCIPTERTPGFGA